MSETTKKIYDWLVLIVATPILLIFLYDMVRNIDPSWLFLGAIIISVLIYWALWQKKDQKSDSIVRLTIRRRGRTYVLEVCKGCGDDWL